MWKTINHKVSSKLFYNLWCSLVIASSTFSTNKRIKLKDSYRSSDKRNEMKCLVKLIYRRWWRKSLHWTLARSNLSVPRRNRSEKNQQQTIEKFGFFEDFRTARRFLGKNLSVLERKLLQQMSKNCTKIEKKILSNFKNSANY